MQYGHFDDTRREYVISTPATPQPWINYLGSQDFLSMISNTMGGYCFYRDAKLQRLLRYRYNAVPGIRVVGSTIFRSPEKKPGIPASPPPKPRWTATSVGMAWAIPGSSAPKIGCGPT